MFINAAQALRAACFLLLMHIRLSPTSMPAEPPVKLKDITLLGKEHLPDGGGYLLLPSQLHHEDLLRLQVVLEGKPLVFVKDQGAGLPPQIEEHLQKEGVTTLVIVPETTDAHSYRAALKDAARHGSVIIYLPASSATVNAPLTSIPGERLDFLVKADIPVVPCYVQRTRDISLPIDRRHPENEIVMAFGKPLEGEDLTLAAYQEIMFALAEQCFARHPILGRHLGYALLQGLKKHGSQNVVIDGKDNSELRFDKILAAAIALSKFIKAETSKQRVGIVLPPCTAGLIANVAVLLAGKTPVNLNFTAGRASIESAIKQSDIDRFLTADTFVRKMQAFPWPPTKQLILMERLMPRLKGKATLWFILSKLLPASLLALFLGVPKRGGDKEALLLFTSGSSGEPKGVVLTHRNLVANVAQFGSRLNMTRTDTVLGSLPLFHSFGCTVTLWYPIICGLNLVYYPSPLEIKKLAELIEKHKISLMIATPTFLRGYLRGVNREQLASIKLCVTGAEKLPRAVAEAFENRFGKPVLEGYGLTETSPVSNVNLPDPEPVGDPAAHPALPACRHGSVGQLLPGMAVRITHVDSGERLPLHQSGIIWFKGANVFTGYFNDPKRTAEVLDSDGWFRTGDVGRIDLDGFLYIEGRLSRFSKIAGEMVPHETVEETIVRSLGLEGESTRRIAIVGVPDIEKGEALIMLTSVPGGPEHQEIVQLRYRLIEHGVPPLWIPKKMIRVTEIPVLASGKLDVKGCEKIAKAAG
jgi:acyl-[acyl-carrier-protein]-phospholipid O-acyltransferase/long-chain-fatty-acid--[acyl-carrier-protein] ligase